MHIEIKEKGTIILTTGWSMFEMNMEELKEIEKATKAVRLLMEELDVKRLSLQTNQPGGTHEISIT